MNYAIAWEAIPLDGNPSGEVVLSEFDGLPFSDKNRNKNKINSFDHRQYCINFFDEYNHVVAQFNPEKMVLYINRPDPICIPLEDGIFLRYEYKVEGGCLVNDTWDWTDGYVITRVVDRMDKEHRLKVYLSADLKIVSITEPKE